MEKAGKNMAHLEKIIFSFFFFNCNFFQDITLLLLLNFLIFVIF